MIEQIEYFQGTYSYQTHLGVVPSTKRVPPRESPSSEDLPFVEQSWKKRLWTV